MALPTVTVSPAGGVFTADTTVTITASRPSTIFCCMWPQPWVKTASGQTSAQVTAAESGSLRCFCVADDTGDFSWSWNYSFIVNKPGGMVSAYRRLGRQDYPLNTRLVAGETGGEWSSIASIAPMFIGAPSNVLMDHDSVTDRTSRHAYVTAGSAAASSARFSNPFGTPGGPAGSAWTGATMSPDQRVFACINVPFDTADQWIGARVNPATGSGYFLAPWQPQNDPYARNMALYRTSGGASSVIGNFGSNLTLNPDDFSSFDGLVVTGQNPVRIRVVTWVADSIRTRPVNGSDQGVEAVGPIRDDRSGPAWFYQFGSWQAYPDLNGIAGAADADGDGWCDFEPSIAAANPPPYRNAAQEGRPYGSMYDRNQRAPDPWTPGHWVVVGDMLDSSASRVLSGQPAIGAFHGSFELAHFYASDFYELTATAGAPSGGSVVLSGLRVPGSVVSVTRR
jgi:hypothetical protein